MPQKHRALFDGISLCLCVASVRSVVSRVFMKPILLLQRGWEPLTVERTISPNATHVLLLIGRLREAETATPVSGDETSLAESPPSPEAPRTIAVTAPLPSPSSERR